MHWDPLKQTAVVEQSLRVQAEFTSPMNFRKFPHDRQSLFVWLQIMPDASEEEVRFHVNSTSSVLQYAVPAGAVPSLEEKRQSDVSEGIRDGILSEWTIAAVDTVPAGRSVLRSNGKEQRVSKCGFMITVQRMPDYYRYNVVRHWRFCILRVGSRFCTQRADQFSVRSCLSSASLLSASVHSCFPPTSWRTD